jgi:hypothetical protein
MASETWQKDQQATLFIDRNSDRFRFCLDYMRDGQVWHPLNVPSGTPSDETCVLYESLNVELYNGCSSKSILQTWS